MQVDITKTDPGQQPRYDGISPVGFAAIDVLPGSVSSPVGDDFVRLPVDLLEAAGKGSVDRPLTVLLTRLRSAPTNAVRSDEERRLARTFTLPTARSFGLSGKARLANSATDDVLVY